MFPLTKVLITWILTILKKYLTNLFVLQFLLRKEMVISKLRSMDIYPIIKKHTKNRQKLLKQGNLFIARQVYKAQQKHLNCLALFAVDHWLLPLKNVLTLHCQNILVVGSECVKTGLDLRKLRLDSFWKIKTRIQMGLWKWSSQKAFFYKDDHNLVEKRNKKLASSFKRTPHNIREKSDMLIM